MRSIIIIMFIIIVSVLSLEAKKLPPLPTVDKVDLQRYAGLWYQFAYIPTSFQPLGAELTTAEYSLHPKGYIIVKNTAYKDRAGRQLWKDITGKAFITDKKTNAKLKVQFFWPFKGNYWITALDKENYNWVVVSEPSRKYLWILTRQPNMDKAWYQTILNLLKERQIDAGKVVITGWFE